MGEAGETRDALSHDASAGQSVRAKLGAGGVCAKERSFTGEEDWNMVGAGGGEGVGPFRKIGARTGQAKARSRTLGRPMRDIENQVKTPGTLRRVNPSSVALSK